MKICVDGMSATSVTVQVLMRRRRSSHGEPTGSVRRLSTGDPGLREERESGQETNLTRRLLCTKNAAAVTGKVSALRGNERRGVNSGLGLLNSYCEDGGNPQMLYSDILRGRGSRESAQYKTMDNGLLELGGSHMNKTRGADRSGGTPALLEPRESH